MMKSVLIVNLLATAATASMASDFASRQEVGTSVGLRGQRRLPKEKDNKPSKEKESNTRKEKESDTTKEKPADNKRGRDDTKKGGADIDLDEYEGEVAKKMEKEKKKEKQAKHDEKHRVKKEKRDKANAKAKRDKTTSPDDAAVADPEPAPEPAPAAPVIEAEEVPEPAPALPPIAEEVSITEDAAETTDATDVAAVDTVEIEEMGPVEDEDEDSDIEEVAPAVDTTTWATDATTATTEDESATAEAINDTRSKATLLPCPSEYDSDVTYVAGDTIEMNKHIFACLSGPYEEFCSIELVDQDWDEQQVKYWEDAWDLVGMCAAPVVGAEAPAAAELELAPIELDDEPELAPIVLDDEPEVAVLVSMPTDAATDSTEWATTDAATTDVAIADLATTDATPMDATDATAWGTTDATTADATTDASATSPSSTEELLVSTELATTTATEAAFEEDDLDLPAPTESPTFMPTVTLPDCPSPYDAARTDYLAGETTEVNEHIFQCRTDGQLYIEDEEGHVLEVIDVSYEKYCNIANWDDALSAESEYARELWNDAWTHEGGCLL